MQQSSTVLVAEVYVVKLISHSTETAMFSHPFFIVIILKVLKAVYSPLQIVFLKNSILKSGCVLVTGCRKPQPYFLSPIELLLYFFFLKYILCKIKFYAGLYHNLEKTVYKMYAIFKNNPNIGQQRKKKQIRCSRSFHMRN